MGSAEVLPGDLIVNVNNCIFERKDPSAGPADEEMRRCGVARLSDLMVLELQGGPNNESRGNAAAPIATAQVSRVAI